ncbi:sigma-70 family RNA polymerase sigma factor [Micromonospora sp. LOL_024]|uniref:sigma-70 family RNA polymerase sigma factor n=1 Tax=Micromonospora sp. LOL_024 TaxID=3345412 RepID=UPI003A8636B9
MNDHSSEPGAAAPRGADDADLVRARAGDDTAFGRAVAPLRRELHVHCYRMLGSVHDADDAVQEALLRAWRGIGRFEGRGSLRAWLYAIATRICLDAVETRRRRAMPVDLGPSSERVVLDGVPRTDTAWLGPYPDVGAAGGATGPHARYEQREAVELAFVAALQHLPGNQRAALLLFEVLGFSVAEIAAMMGTSVTSVNSALARARRVVAERVPAPTQQQTLRDIGDARLRQIVTAFAAAFERQDVDALVALLTEDVTWSMPPLAQWYAGLDAVVDFAAQVPLGRCPSWRPLSTSANGQPAVAFYLGADRISEHHGWSITVLTLRGEQIAGITSFVGSDYFALFALPSSIAGGAAAG